ncbi:MAG TPA: hypothetical protein VN661_10185, partial [Candidatus Acidoferrales bacterium]|nr:hypothetical protein [Candidatus Acidoferrales bacterium]
QHVPSRAEDHLWYHDQCPSLQKTELPDLAKYLQTATPDAGNSVCVTYAIDRIEDAHYEQAVPILVKLLDFQRPGLPYEHSYVMTHIPPDKYPARATLESIGMPAVPALLQAISDKATTTVARENALDALVLIYGRQVNLPYPAAAGIVRLKQEAANATDTDTKERLDSAVTEALSRCALWDSVRPKQVAACQQAAKDGTVPQ